MQPPDLALPQARIDRELQHESLRLGDGITRQHGIDLRLREIGPLVLDLWLLRRLDVARGIVLDVAVDHRFITNFKRQ